MDLRILELFSGIGGMHFAFDYSKLPGNVVAAYDINGAANETYRVNHPKTFVRNKNILSLTPEEIRKLGANVILMSPPCQPYTRVGKKLDVHDNRSDALQHICTILPLCEGIKYVLLENVKGFEKSRSREIFVEALKSSGFHYCELILSPIQFGIPNSRTRYYCIARKTSEFPFSVENILEHMPVELDPKHFEKLTIQHIIEPEDEIKTRTYVSYNDLVLRSHLMDIVTLDSSHTMCFTKAYSRYVEGTGSVFTTLSKSDIDEAFKMLELLNANTEEATDSERFSLLKPLRLRYFTPLEVARLMSFPDSIKFPKGFSDKTKYRLLGNSINVLVVGELIKLLFS